MSAFAPILESSIEAYFVAKVKSVLRGRTLKFASPGNAGVPDRIVFLPHGRVALVELKGPKKKPQKLQEHTIAWLRETGCDVSVLDGRTAIDQWVADHAL